MILNTIAAHWPKMNGFYQFLIFFILAPLTITIFSIYGT
jgi:hypothetical protein